MISLVSFSFLAGLLLADYRAKRGRCTGLWPLLVLAAAYVVLSFLVLQHRLAGETAEFILSIELHSIVVAVLVFAIFRLEIIGAEVAPPPHWQDFEETLKQAKRSRQDALNFTWRYYEDLIARASHRINRDRRTITIALPANFWAKASDDPHIDKVVRDSRRRIADDLESQARAFFRGYEVSISRPPSYVTAPA